MAVALCSCSSSHLVEIPRDRHTHAWEPSFYSEDNYVLGAARLAVFCTNREWSVSLTIDEKAYPQVKYAELDGLGGGGIWKLYHTDIDRNGEQDFVAALYTGSSSGSDYGQVVFFLPEDDHLRVVSHWTHDFTESKIKEYYGKAQQGN